MTLEEELLNDLGWVKQMAAELSHRPGTRGEKTEHSKTFKRFLGGHKAKEEHCHSQG